MPRLQDVKFVCLDVEATGLDCSQDRILELAAVRFTLSQMEDEFESLVDPEREIPKESIRIHNISQEMVAGKPKIGDLLPEFLAFVGLDVIVGHGIDFDIDIIMHEAKRVGCPCSLDKNASIDTLRLARLYGQSPTNSLAVLRQHFNIADEGAHRAKSDVIVNVQVFRHLVRPFKSLEEIQRSLAKPILMKMMPLGKHKGRRFSDMPIEYLLWAARQKFDNDLLFSLRSEIQRRKKRASFQDAVNPFHTL
jgi:DNA polymerase-3 subunit epsilon